MAISKDLFLAILSMDAYNRGYGAGLSGAGKNDPDGLGVTTYDSNGNVANEVFIGNARIVEDKGDAEAQTAGFYAVAYQITGTGYAGLAEGQTVISYRGTDAAATEYPGVDFPFAPSKPLAAAVLGNFGRLAGKAEVFIHPMAARQVEKEVLEKLRAGVAG